MLFVIWRAQEMGRSFCRSKRLEFHLDRVLTRSLSVWKFVLWWILVDDHVAIVGVVYERLIQVAKIDLLDVRPWLEVMQLGESVRRRKIRLGGNLIGVQPTVIFFLRSEMGVFIKTLILSRAHRDNWKAIDVWHLSLDYQCFRVVSSPGSTCKPDAHSVRSHLFLFRTPPNLH
jgi:hypothetical protein